MNCVLYTPSLSRDGKAVGWSELMRGTKAACCREMNRLNQIGKGGRIRSAVYTDAGVFVSSTL